MNPKLWISPENAGKVARAIRRGIGQKEPMDGEMNAARAIAAMERTRVRLDLLFKAAVARRMRVGADHKVEAEAEEKLYAEEIWAIDWMITLARRTP